MTTVAPRKLAQNRHFTAYLHNLCISIKNFNHSLQSFAQLYGILPNSVKSEVITDSFSPELFIGLVESMTVISKDEIGIEFRNGSKISIKI